MKFSISHLKDWYPHIQEWQFPQIDHLKLAPQVWDQRVENKSLIKIKLKITLNWNFSVLYLTFSWSFDVLQNSAKIISIYFISCIFIYLPYEKVHTVALNILQKTMIIKSILIIFIHLFRPWWGRISIYYVFYWVVSIYALIL